MPGDLDDLRRMHAPQGFGYPLPDLESPMFVSKLVLEEDDGDDGSENGREVMDGDSLRDNSRRHPFPRVTMAILQRLTAETYLLHDPAAGTPRLRWQHFLALHDAARRSSAQCGLDDVQAFLPPRIARAFGRRLERLGWRHDPWPCFSLRI
jgi:hypothetical protein